MQMINVGTREIILTIAIVSSALTSTNVVVTKEKKNEQRFNQPFRTEREVY